MKKQLSLSGLIDELSQVKTRKKEFLGQMDCINFMVRVESIKPYYYKGERGNKPYDLETMLRIHLLQNLYNGDTIGRFRALLMAHGLQEQLFAQVVELLMERGTPD